MSEDKGNDLVSGLTDGEIKILKERFGIENLDQKSLEEVGKQFQITREKIREIEEKAIKKLNPDDDPSNNGPEVA